MMMNLLGSATLSFSVFHYFQSGGSLALVIIGFGFLIFIHELGHFLVAKWVGVRCPQFAIGFGHAVLAYRRGIGLRFGSTEKEYEKRAKASLSERGIDVESVSSKQIHDAGDKLGLGETEYRLNYVFLGGYVKMVGQEDMDPTAASDDPRSFTRQPIWARACILSAGVTMNLIFGLVFLTVAFMAGVEFPPAIVGGVVPGSPAAMAYARGHAEDAAYRGLKVGDKILTVDGNAVRDMHGVELATALADPGTTLYFRVQRMGQAQPLAYAIAPTYHKSMGRLTIGVLGPSDLNVIGVGDMSGKQGLKPGMTLVSVNGKTVSRYASFYRAVVEAKGKTVQATFVPGKRGKKGGKQAKGKAVVIKVSASPLLTRAGNDQPANLAGLVPTMEVGAVMAGDPAAKAGIKAGDILAQVGAVSWPMAEQVQQAIKSSGGAGVTVVVWRDGKLVPMGKIKPTSKGIIGVTMQPDVDTPRVGQTLADSPAAGLKLAAGSMILKMAGRQVGSWADMQRILGGLKVGGPTTVVKLTYRLNLAKHPVETGKLVLDRRQAARLAEAGWMPAPDILFGQLREKVGSSNPISAAVMGVQKTKQFMIQTYISLLRLLQGSVSPKELRGPVGIVQIGAQATSQGWEYLMFFLGVISVDLAVLNFLPLPIVDGGHVVFLIIEKVKGSPVSASVQTAAMIVGLVLIAGVMLMATYNDIARFFPG